jgi:hypothetical protein
MRLRPTLTRPIHALDHAVGRLARRRQVLFEGRLPLSLAVLRPVLEALGRDARIEVWVTSDGRADLARAYAEAGLADRYLPRERCTWRRFDLYLNTDPWRPVRLRRCARSMNFFHGVAGKYDLDQPPRAARLFDRYDRVAFVNADRRQRYLAAGIVAGHQAALVGYPKLDRLATGRYDGRAVRASLGLAQNRPTVTYAPTWSSTSSLHLCGEAIIDTLLSLGCNVIAKLHDNCFLPGRKYAGNIDWRERLGRFSTQDRFRLAPTADACPYLAASDLLVTDHSSIGFEFLALDRPLIVFDAPDLPRAARINPEKVALLQSGADVVSTIDQLRRAVPAALAYPQRRSADRRRIADQMFYGLGGATGRALDVVYDLLALPAPVKRPAPAASPVLCR